MNFFQPKQWIALDWGSDTWKWLEPADSYAELISAPQTEAEILARLREQVEKRQCRGSRVAAGFFEKNLTIRLLRLPKMPEEDLLEAIRWRLRDITEESLDETIIRYSLVGEEAGDVPQLALLCFAIQQKTIQKKSDLLKQAGLIPGLLEPTPVALAAALESLHPTSRQEDGWLACADLGASTPYLIVLGKGKLCFVQSLEGLEGMEATKLGVSIQTVLDNFLVQAQTEKIERLFLAGKGAGEKSLPETLSKNLGIPTALLHPPTGVENSAHLFGPAAGLAMFCAEQQKQ